VGAQRRTTLGLSWHMGTPHVRRRLSPRGPTRGPIETRSQKRKTPLAVSRLLSHVKARLHVWEACN
jgi:hypothetical protein